MSRRTLTYEQAVKIREFGSQGLSTSRLATMFECNPTTVARILRGEIYTSTNQYAAVNQPKRKNVGKKVRLHWGDNPK